MWASTWVWAVVLVQAQKEEGDSAVPGPLIAGGLRTGGCLPGEAGRAPGRQGAGRPAAVAY